MRPYFISVMTISIVVFSFCFIWLFSSVVSIVGPEHNLSGRTYENYISLDSYKKYFKAKYSKRDCVETNFSDDEWIKKWEEYKSVKLASEVHDGKSTFMHTILVQIVFCILFLLHFYLLKKLNNPEEVSK